MAHNSVGLLAKGFEATAIGFELLDPKGTFEKMSKMKRRIERWACSSLGHLLVLKGNCAKIRKVFPHSTSIAATHFNARHTNDKKAPDASFLLALKGSGVWETNRLGSCKRRTILLLPTKSLEW